jgi:iron complex outermembrane receptor protein
MANRSFGSVLGTIVLVLVVAVIGAPVLAQDEDDTTQTDQEGAEEEQEAVLDTITVTATKREENPMEIPISLSVLNTEQMEIFTTAGVDVRMLSGRVPSLVIESSFGRAFPRFYMRGLGNPDFDLNASQPVSLVYDEVVLENPVVKGMPLWDLERTEVLRGPQGTLFGRNTPAGVVKFDSKKPSQEQDGFARLSYGTFNTIDFRGAIGGRLSDTFSARLSLPPVASLPGTERLDRQQIHRREQRPGRLPHRRLPSPVSLGAQREVQRPAQPPRLGCGRDGPDFPREHHGARIE